MQRLFSNLLLPILFGYAVKVSNTSSVFNVIDARFAKPFGAFDFVVKCSNFFHGSIFLGKDCLI